VEIEIFERPLFPSVSAFKMSMPPNSSSPKMMSSSPKTAPAYPIQSSMDEDALQHLQATLAMNLATYEHAEPAHYELGFELSQFTKEKNYSKELEVNSGIKVQRVLHNAPMPVLYEEALRNEEGSYITSTGALAVSSGAKTGRCPGDKRVVEAENLKDIWWGKVNIPLSADAFIASRERAIDYLNTREQLYVVDAFAGWSKRYRIRVRIITTRAYHALFMQNMLVMPTEEEQVNFVPEFVIYNAGCFPANKYTKGMSSNTCVALSFERREMVVLGTQYAGEMKKGILTLMMYEMPRLGQLCLHSSATIGMNNDVTIFFGLSGTGKTTLSADPKRNLIGDDEHVWTDEGVFNVEGGCYAKAVNLTRENEPEIFDAIQFGTVLENVCFNSQTRVVDYKDISLTENTRAAYPLAYIPNAVIPADVKVHPQAVVLLCCDAFGVIPPVSILTPEQVEYYFISGYTAKVAGTEQGIKEPTACFSPCFAGPFIVWHPVVYSKLLSDKLKHHKANAYLLNTGWVGGAYGVGKRCPLKYTRKIVDAINDGSLANVATRPMEVFNLEVPTEIPGVPSELLFPRTMWKDENAFDAQVAKLAGLFISNFKEYESKCPTNVKEAGPKL
jgi:phosphoenolpyruvate carboxykinase (ATP)